MNEPTFLTRSLDYLPPLLDGALTTLALSAIAVLCGFFAGVFVYTMLASRNRWLAAAARVYVSVFRGTPMLAQLLVFYYVPAALGLGLPSPVAAVIGLSLNTAAYQSQILSAGFHSIPKGQREAAGAFGLTRWQTLWHVEVPQVVAATLPALVSEMIDIVKASAVISVISVTDLMRVSQQLASATYRPLETYTLGALMYLAITTLLSLAGHRYERRISRRA
ncbi:amino acid ABC transporter permease [Paraburkholderia kururiensis]|uniref:amino acid ABC transporter permease n=1 Tax=Paraburkholderia kururiensis TaxID=984307 RepID=UPI000B0494C8|nr:amino acid ABC transporter permease [Paraburkholderia kururiensis]